MPVGIVISYAPKRLNAKNKKIAVISRLIHGFAAKRFIPAAPTNIASSIPSSVNVAMMPSEYIVASLIAFARLPAEWFVKYETVIGIIGNTHGVSSDSAPSVTASQINAQRSVGGWSLRSGWTAAVGLGGVRDAVAVSRKLFSRPRPGE